MDKIKPPLGLRPKWLHDEQRYYDIVEAIGRYIESGRKPPKEWVLEMASYCPFINTDIDTNAN